DDPAHKVTEREANKNSTEMISDGLDRVILTTDPFQKTIATTYDGVNMRVQVDKKHQRNEFDYDSINRPIETREFDENGVLKTTTGTVYEDDHNRVTETDRRGTQVIRQLDSRGRLVQLSRKHPDLAAQYGTQEVVLEKYQYDGNNNKTFFTDAAGNQTKY